ncbi:high light inducible protein [Oscillatoriales cyanobacterium USR001]|nr:high light inducible protein [Oscillatoriales cyanobacterium USR001]
MTTESPKSTPESTPETANKPEPSFGWSAYAEQINGRFAMVGFVALLLLEFFTRQDFFTWLGM